MEGHNDASLQSSLLLTEQAQPLQPVFIGEVFQPTENPLDWI